MEKRKKVGRIIELYEDKAVIQVFEGTENMSLDNTRTKFNWTPDGSLSCTRYARKNI